MDKMIARLYRYLANLADMLGGLLFPGLGQHQLQPALAGGGGLRVPIILFNEGEGSGTGDGGQGGGNTGRSAGDGGSSNSGGTGNGGGGDDPFEGLDSATKARIEANKREAVNRALGAQRERLVSAGVLQKGQRLEDVPAAFRAMQGDLEQSRGEVEALQAQLDEKPGKGGGATMPLEQHREALKKQKADLESAHAQALAAEQAKVAERDTLISTHVVGAGVMSEAERRGLDGEMTLAWMLSPMSKSVYDKVLRPDPAKPLGVLVFEADGVTPAISSKTGQDMTLAESLEVVEANPKLSASLKRVASTGGTDFGGGGGSRDGQDTGTGDGKPPKRKAPPAPPGKRDDRLRGAVAKEFG